SDRILMRGLDVLLEPQAYSTLSLVLHELLSNSVTQGALCDENGQIDIAWELNAEGDLELSWRESGKRPRKTVATGELSVPVIDRSVPKELNGGEEFKYTAKGVEAHFVIPSRFLRRTSEIKTNNSTPVAKSGPLSGAVLVVEDNMIIAFDVEEML